MHKEHTVRFYKVDLKKKILRKKNGKKLALREFTSKNIDFYSKRAQASKQNSSFYAIGFDPKIIVPRSGQSLNRLAYLSP